VAYPKLVLEMTLIKLATMTPLVPVTTLLDRLEDLERRQSAGALSPGSPSARRDSSTRSHPSAADVARPSSPPPAGRSPVRGGSGAQTAVRPDTPPRSDDRGPDPAIGTESAAAPTGHGWDEFLQYIAREKVTLLAYLQKSLPPRLDGGDLALAVPKGYYYDYLAQRDHAQLVEVRAAEPSEGADTSAPTGAEPKAADLHAAALDHPAVRAAVEILGGEVREVKARSRRGRGDE
jgi:DNA polymerase-3 subunit gamma/tau